MFNFRQSQSTALIYCWIPESVFEDIDTFIREELHNKKKLTVQLYGKQETKTTEPTYIKTNKVTFPFQEIVNTYGIPRY